jgi:mannose/fructose/N-acetylgalactosamine-specific phosphotransferase system component IIC
MTLVIAVLPVALLGAILGLDVVSFPQAMISRPLVAATLAGTLVGQPVRGLVVGVVLELFALETLPFGASRYPEWGSASVVGGALYGMQPEWSRGALAVVVCGALVTAAAGGWSMVQHRRLIARWSNARHDELAAGSSSAVTTLQLRGLTLDLARGGALTAASLLLCIPVTQVLVRRWPAGDAKLSVYVVIVLAAAVGASALWNVTHTSKGASWFLLGGLVIGSGLMAVT